MLAALLNLDAKQSILPGPERPSCILKLLQVELEQCRVH